MSRKFILTVFVASFMLGSQFARAQSEGGSNGGGGNAGASTPAQVRDIIANVGLYAEFLWLSAGLQPTSIVPIQDPFNAEAATKIIALFSDPWIATEELQKILVVQDAPCTYGGQERDAALFDDNGVNKICLSVDRLSRFAPDALKLELHPLLFHELAHAAGYSEAEAVAFQNYIHQIQPYMPSNAECVFRFDAKSQSQEVFVSTYVRDSSKYRSDTQVASNDSWPDIDTYENIPQASVGPWSLAKGGSITFPMRVKRHVQPEMVTIEFGPVANTGTVANPYYVTQISTATITVGGEVYAIEHGQQTDLYIDPACVR